MSLNDTVSAERVHIAFYGMRNAGKSSLVNAVTGQSLSVVSEVKGTTTDPVKKAMELLPLGPVVIIDTPGLDYEALLPIDVTRPALSASAIRTVETSVKYEGYIKRQNEAIRRVRAREDMALPADIDYKEIRGLSLEAAEKLSVHRPLSVGEASRLDGVTPADVSVLLIYLGSKSDGRGTF